jgi:D-alanyl-D-alanine dipeptidase
MSEIVPMSDPRVAAIPVADCGEPLVDVRSDGRLLIDARRRDAAGAFARLREGVAARLLRAGEELPTGMRLLFVEGDRPPALQRDYFARCAGALRSAHPGYWALATGSANALYRPREWSGGHAV